MNNLYVFYVMVDFDQPSQAYLTGIRSRLNLVIAESEDAAITIMKNHVSPYLAQISTPEFPNEDASKAVGHGTEISEFLQDPGTRVDYRTLIDLYRDKYNNYYGNIPEAMKDINIALWDENGPVQTLNDYNHGTYKKKEPDGELIKNNFVIITSEQEDELSGGIAFVGSKESTEDESIVAVGNSIIISDATYVKDDTEVSLSDNLQVKLTTAGEILVRQWSAESEGWSEWSLSPIFAPEAPEDGKEYVRINASWKAILYDEIPTDGSPNHVKSSDIKKYVDNAVIRVYRYMGSKTVAEICDITDLTVGDVYNVKDAGIVTTGSEPIEVKVGDNIAWDGNKWDNLNGIFDHYEYVKFTNYATETVAGVVKIDGQCGLNISGDGVAGVMFSEESDIDDKSSNKALSPYTLDYAMYKATHQIMSNDYDKASLPVSELVRGDEGRLPVSYDAVKDYIDSIPTSGGSAVIEGDYQPIEDDAFETDAKTVSGAINEINDKVDVIVCSLNVGWNRVKLNKLYPISWVFSGKPYCYTEDGYSVDFRVRNINNYIVDGVHAFEIYVPESCELRCSVSPYSIVSGIPSDYMLISYYYTGNDGKDLDTITVATGASDIGHVGYQTASTNTTIKDSSGNILAKWGGDNEGGGTSAGDTQFYEEILLDLNAIRAHDDHDLTLTLYGAWFESISRGNIHVSINCYCGSIDMNALSANSTSKRFDLTSLGEPTYTNPSELVCFIPAEVDRGDSDNYRNTYTKAFSVNIHHTSAEGNMNSFEIKRLA